MFTGKFATFCPLVARAAQFEPLPRTSSGSGLAAALVWGTLVFEWQTLPLSPTNAPASRP